MKYYLIKLVLPLIFSVNVWSNTIFDTVPSLFFEQIENEQNVDLGIVEDFVQDSIGFIWIGTSNGLFRYDGVKFKHYTHHRDNTKSLRSNIILDLFIDSKSNLWIATESGLNKYNPSTEDFTYYPVKSEEDTTELANFISAIAEDHSGNLWIATYDEGVYQFGGEQNSLIPLAHLVKKGKGNINLYIQTIMVDQEDILWMGTMIRGVQYFRPDDQSLNELSDNLSAKEEKLVRQVCTIAEDVNGTIWFGTRNNGLINYNKLNSELKHYSESGIGSNHIPSNAIMDIMVDQNENVWLGTSDGGILLSEKFTERFTAYQKRNKPGSISTNNVRAIFEDNNNNYWVGGYHAPINFLNGSGKEFLQKRDFVKLPNGKFSNEIGDILIDSHKRYWIGTGGAGVVRFDPGSSKPQQIIHGYSPMANNHNFVLSLEEDKQGNIWIGFYEGGLACYMQDTKTVKYYTPDGTDKTPQGKQIWEIYSTDSALWIGSELGVEYMDTKTGIFTFDIKTATGITRIRQGCSEIIQDSEQRMLMGTHLGLYVYDKRTHDIHHYLPISGDTTSIADKWVVSILIDSKGNYWIGTHGGGLCQWNGYSSFTTYNTSHGLSGNIVENIQEDYQGNIWLYTNRGISKLNTDSYRFNNFYFGDRISEVRYHPNSSCYDGKLMYVGGMEGVTYFNPTHIQVPNESVPVVFTDYIIHNKQIDPQKDKTQHLAGINEIELNPRQNFFTIEYSVLNFAIANQIKYRYKLNNYHKQWQHNGNNTKVTFANIKPGRYTLELIASNQESIGSQESASLDIIINPPFYRKFWFVFLLVLITVFILYKIHEILGNRFKREASYLSDQVTTRTQELEKRNIEIDQQKQEITLQRDLATEQRDKIKKQKEELEEHRSRLEDLVEERTQDLVQAKDMAEASDRLKTAFLENLSHQIRTPMNAILGFINLLTEKIDDVVSREYYLRIINDSGRKMLALIHDIIDFSKMHTGELQPEYTECNSSSMIREIVSSLREKVARENGILSIIADVPEQDVVMYCDENKLRQIITKLLENSFDCTDKGYIKAGIARREENHIIFYVEDTGSVIERGEEEKVFDRFYTVQEFSDNKVQFGSGLGLAFAKVAVELLGGKIWVTPGYESGAVFYFSIPFMQVVNQQHAAKTKESGFSWPNKRILVAEDEESNYFLIEAILRDTGVILEHVTDGVELLELFEKDQGFDLVLLDLKMPRMGGINAMKIIRESNKEIPVIVQTAYDQTNHRQQCIEIGCDDFLVKPLRKKELLAKVDKYLGD